MTDSEGEAAFPTPPPPPPPDMAPPPGYASYGSGTQGAYSPFQRVGGLGRTLAILVTIIIPVQLLLVAFIFLAKGKAQDFVDGTISKDDFDKGIAPYGLIGIVSAVLQLATLIVTILWMFRMAKNQLALGRQGTWGPPWAIAGWFLPPCILYVIPYLMFRDLWKSSDPESGPDWRRNPIGPVVHVWWVLFGLAPIAFFSVTFGNFRPESDKTDIEEAQDLIDSVNLNIIATLVSVCAAFAYLTLVRQLTARHKQTINEV